MKSLTDSIFEAAKAVKESSRTVAFTGAGISVESGIPPFRGEKGLWDRYDPTFLDISYFHNNPEKSWALIKEIFYDFFGKSEPNPAHYALAEMEEKGFVHSIITQNIDNLHQIAGSRVVYEFHGNSRNLICEKCSKQYSAQHINLSDLPPTCEKCGSVLKPDFVFFGEPIPADANSASFKEAEEGKVFILIGTTGEIMPASLIPLEAKKNGAAIIEINIAPSRYTDSITDIFIQGKAGVVMPELLAACNDL